MYQIPALNTVATLVILAGVYQVGRCVLEFTPWNVFPFIPDIDEMVSRQRREGLFAAVMTFSRKPRSLLPPLLWVSCYKAADL